jgi:putative peptide zinc metalloprotease protein
MTTTSAAAGRGDAGASPATASEVPVRADGVQLIGEMRGSGYREPPALVRRGDGQMLQLSPLLYAVLEAIDDRRSHAEIAEVVSTALGRSVSTENVATLVDAKLRPLGLLLRQDGSEPTLKKARPLLGLQLRAAVTDPATTRRLTAPFAALFNPVIIVAVVAAFLAASWWVLFVKGLASAAHEAFHQPGLLLLIFVVTVLSAGFHEFGHAAAARRGGATPGVMGMGLYLFWPAFYTDVTDSYRLGRGGRLRTDLGGLYFNAIVAVGIVGAWWLTGYDALLLVVATQILQMLRQLLPFVRFDGYHVLADLTGVPDLYHRIKPVLLGALPWRWRDARASVLKPWARVVVTVWVLVVVPVCLLSVLTMVLTLPRVLATAWVSLQERMSMVQALWGDGQVAGVLAQLLAIVALLVPMAGTTYLVVRLVRQLSRSVWRATDGRPARRALSLVLAAALVAGLGYVWWPRPDTYRPIAAYEQGTIGSIVPRVAPDLGDGLETGSRGTISTFWPDGAVRPTEDHPTLAVVMVPHGGSGSPTPTSVADPSPTPSGEPSATPTDDASPRAPTPSASGTAEATQTSSATPAPPTGPPAAGVFPFDLPLPPGEGDNQALAVNTTDDTVVYDVAFALVWVDDDTVTNTNEAFAAASCTNCAAVAVSFQVVLVLSDADVVVPANLATAVNYNCLQCLTYALATQLVITLDGPLSEESMAALQDLWTQLADFAAGIDDVPLDELQDVLDGYEEQILDVIENDPSATSATGPSDGSDEPTSATTGTSPTSGTTSSPTPTDTSTGAPTSSATTAPSSPTIATPTSPTETSGAPSSSPSGSASPSETPSGATSATPSPGATSSGAG